MLIERIYLRENVIVFERVDYDPRLLFFESVEVFRIDTEFYVFFKDKKIHFTYTTDRKKKFKLYKVLLMKNKLFQYSE